MKISYFKESTKKKTVRNADLSDVMENMKKELNELPVNRLASGLKGADLFYSASFKLEDGLRVMTTYNGVVVLEISNLTGRQEAVLVKRMAAELPQTLAAFALPDGTQVFILVLFSRPDGSLPNTEEEALLFHAHAYRRAVQLYQGQIPFKIDTKSPVPNVAYRFVQDPDVYYAPEAQPVRLTQPTEMPGETTWQEAAPTESDPLRRLMPGYERTDKLSMLFETSLSAALAEAGPFNEADPKPLLVSLAINCFRSGVPEEEMVRAALMHLQLRSREMEVRQTFRNVYGKSNGFGSKPCLCAEQLLAIQTDEFMKRRYELRYNTMKCEAECRERSPYSYDFSKVIPRLLNSIALNGQEEGIKMWDRDVNRYIYSDRVPLYSPIDHYLCSLPEWDGKDRIRPLADTIPCNNPHWRNLFHRWFLGMVAQWRGIDKKHANSTAPLLVGPQGTGKSTFCLGLLPPQLRAYYAEGVDVGNKQNTEMYLSRFALINMDEFDQVKESQQGFLKHVMQKPAVTIRKPHQSSVESLRRYASFIATSNHSDVLTDSSGSRRFICIRLTGAIDYSKKLNHDQLYAQAKQAIRRGERYWFDTREEAILTENNKEFQMQVPAEQLFLQFFRSPEAGETGEKLLAVEILGRLQNKKLFNLSATKIIHFGRILNKHHIPSKKASDGTYYHVVER